MRIGLVVLNSEIGGTEKRFAGLFSYLTGHSNHRYSLLLPAGLFNHLCARGLLSPDLPEITKVFVQPPFSLYNHLPLEIAGRKIRGLTRLLAPLWNWALRSSEVRAFFQTCDVIHYALATPHLLESLPFDRPLVIEAQDAGIQALRNAFIEKGWNHQAFFNFASERIRRGYERLTGHHDNDRFFVSPCSFVDYSKTYMMPKKKIITFVGRFVGIKNPVLFVEAIAHLGKRRKDFKAYLLGDNKGDNKTSMECLILSGGLKNVIECRYHPAPQEILSQSLIFVSLQEGDNYHSQALMEAMACGCAVVASDVGETSKLVSNETGFRVPFDPQIIADRLDQMLTAFDQTVAMGKAARAKVMREQTISRYAAYLETLYEKAVNDVRPRRNR